MNLDTYVVPVKFKVDTFSFRNIERRLNDVSRRFKSIPVGFSLRPEATTRVRNALRGFELRASKIPVGFSVTPDSTRRARTALRNIEARAGNVRVNFNPSSGSSARMQSAATRSGSANQGGDARMGGVGGAIATGAAFIGADKVKQFVTSSVNLAKDFETTMIDANAILRATPEEMERLEAAAKRIGSTTSLTASQSAGAIEILARNGLKAEQILGGALESSVALSLAMRADLGGSADLMTDVISQFNLKGKDMQKTTDLLAGATVNSKFGFNDMRLAIAQAGGVAGKVGVEFDDFVAALALTSSSFSSGADAGTSFKTFMNGLVPKAKPAAAAMMRLGLMTEEGGNKFFDAQGNMKGMSDITGELEKAFKKLSESERLDAAQTIFGTDAMRTALSLADKGRKGFDAVAVSIDKVAAAELKAAKEQGLQGSLNRLSSAWEGFKMNLISKETLKYLSDLADKLVNVLKGMEAFSKKIADFKKSVDVDFTPEFVKKIKAKMESGVGKPAIEGVDSGLVKAANDQEKNDAPEFFKKASNFVADLFGAERAFKDEGKAGDTLNSNNNTVKNVTVNQTNNNTFNGTDDNAKNVESSTKKGVSKALGVSNNENLGMGSLLGMF